MGFIIKDHHNNLKSGYTILVDVAAGIIHGNGYSSETKGYNGESETLAEYREVLSAAPIGIYGKQIDTRKGVGNLILEHTLETIRSRFEDQNRHLDHVQRYSVAIGKAMGLKANDLRKLGQAAKMHDIGKAFIEPALLNKPQKLTKEEMDEIKKHPEIGYWLLKADKRHRELARYVRHHHERWDGLGYPGGLKSGEIPLFSRIIAVADAYDAMTRERVYQRTKNREEAVREMIAHSGSQFDPKILKIFVEKVLLGLTDLEEESR